MKDFLDLAHDRYSVRKFSIKEIEDDKISKIIEAGKVAPTAVNYQPLKFFVFKSKESIQKLAEAHPFPFAKNAPLVIIVGSDKKNAWVRNYDEMNYADVDASIAATHIMLEIHDLGLGSTWCGHFNQEKVKELFPETKDFNLIAMFPIGYIAEDAAPTKTHTLYKSDEELVKVY